MQANCLQQLSIKGIIERKRTSHAQSETYLVTRPPAFLLICFIVGISSGTAAHGLQQSRGTGRPVSPSGATPVTSRALAPISAAVEEAIREHKYPGAVVLIGHGGEVVYDKALGDRATVPRKLPM